MDLKKLPWLFPRLLPKNVRHAFYRSLVSLNSDLPRQLRVKLARTQEELEAAFRLLHDCYVKSGFMKPDPSGLRIPIYHALPSTSTIIALWNEEVVGTVSIIRDNPLGLPLEKIFDIAAFRARGQRVAEISALAVSPSFRGNRGEILFPLLKYLYQYCVRYFGVDYMQIAVNPKHADFYEAILFFKSLEERVVENYDFVDGAPAVGRYLGMRFAYKRFEKAYGKKGIEKDLFAYFTQSIFPNLEFPNRKYFKVFDPVMTPELLNYFFNERTKLFQRISDREKAILASVYLGSEYKAVLPEAPGEVWQGKKRRGPRFDVHCPGELVTISGGKGSPIKVIRSVPLLVRTASRHGFSARVTSGLRYGQTYPVYIRVAKTKTARVFAYPVWDDAHGSYGFAIDEADKSWEEFIEYLVKSSDPIGHKTSAKEEAAS